jgi:hypothetical protein
VGHPQSFWTAKHPDLPAPKIWMAPFFLTVGSMFWISNKQHLRPGSKEFKNARHLENHLRWDFAWYPWIPIYLRWFPFKIVLEIRLFQQKHLKCTTLANSTSQVWAARTLGSCEPRGFQFAGRDREWSKCVFSC